MAPALRRKKKKKRKILYTSEEEKKNPLYFGFIRISYQPQEQRYPGVLPLCDNDINPFLLLTSGEGLLQSQLRAALPMQRYRPTCSDVHRGILEFTYRKPSVGGWEAVWAWPVCLTVC